LKALAINCLLFRICHSLPALLFIHCRRASAGGFDKDLVKPFCLFIAVVLQPTDFNKILSWHFAFSLAFFRICHSLPALLFIHCRRASADGI